jgi:hypothetical protein
MRILQVGSLLRRYSTSKCRQWKKIISSVDNLLFGYSRGHRTKSCHPNKWVYVLPTCQRTVTFDCTSYKVDSTYTVQFSEVEPSIVKQEPPLTFKQELYYSDSTRSAIPYIYHPPSPYHTCTSYLVSQHYGKSLIVTRLPYLPSIRMISGLCSIDLVTHL